MTQTELELAALVEGVEERRRVTGVGCADAPRPVAAPRVPPLCPKTIADQEREAGEQAAREERRRRQEAFERLVKAAGERYRGCTFQTYEVRPSKAMEYQSRAVAKIREYAECVEKLVRSGAGLILYGPVGTGKDHLAFAVARRAVLRFGLSVAWHDGQSWFGRNRDRIEEGGTEESLIREIRRPDVVVLSDPLPPMGSLTQFQAIMLFRAVNARAAAGKPVIVTLNVADDEEANQRLSVPTWDRMRDAAWMISCRWPSYRTPALSMRP
jgi:DNA replication protein DnaC